MRGSHHTLSFSWCYDATQFNCSHTECGLSSPTGRGTNLPYVHEHAYQPNMIHLFHPCSIHAYTAITTCKHSNCDEPPTPSSISVRKHPPKHVCTALQYTWRSQPRVLLRIYKLECWTRSRELFAPRRLNVVPNSVKIHPKNTTCS